MMLKLLLIVRMEMESEGMRCESASLWMVGPTFWNDAALLAI